MSGPVTTEDSEVTAGTRSRPVGGEVELIPGRQTVVGSVPVRRVLPRRPRRTVGAWCFADHMGPVSVSGESGVDIGPHPHMGLQTVTWLVEGEIVHRDSLGSEQPIRPGQLNLMTAGYGVAHAEENTGGYRGPLHGVQLWVAQPEATRDGPPAFEHHEALPRLDLPSAVGTVLIGDFAGATSPARRDSDLVGVEWVLRPPGTSLPLRPECEYALVVLEGPVLIEGRLAAPGTLAYLGTGHDERHFEVAEPTLALLLGGIPFDEAILLWWNFVARTEEEVTTARDQWAADDGRFGTVYSMLSRIGAPEPPWRLHRGGTGAT